MSEVKVNKITPTTNCGTVTLGDSGDTVAIPCGVTLSNSGSITNSGTITNTGTISGGTITGTIDNQVNWDTTAKTAGFTAVAGNGYFVNTTSGAITVTLPTTPTAGDLVGIKDYANTANTNNITIDRNGEPIQGTANNFTISVAGTSITLIYVDGTQGWVSTGAAKASDITEQATFIIATGGTITCCGDFKIHTFTGPGTFTVTTLGNSPTVPTGGPSNVDYLVVAGGGGGGGAGNGAAGAGGGGGYRESSGAASGCYTASPLGACVAALPVSVQSYPITVGAGGAGGSDSPLPGSSGSNSIFSTITSTSGGGGGNRPEAGSSGGSGGGGGGINAAGGSGNSPPVSPPQGNNGGAGVEGPAPNPKNKSGAGGGATAVGASAVGPTPFGTMAVGGTGATSCITGSPVGRAGGGGGGSRGAYCSPGTTPVGNGSTCGSGAPSSFSISGAALGGSFMNGVANRGGGGGGASSTTDNPPGSSPYVAAGGAGGSGIVVIRYKYQ
jgi:hypothetical protein